MNPPPIQLVHAIRDLELASGGPSRSIPQLVQAIQEATGTAAWTQHVIFGDRGHVNATLELSSRLYTYAIQSRSALAGLSALARTVKGLHEKQPIDLLHLHGLWSPELHSIMRWARRQKLPYVVSPRGMLSEWCFNHKRFKKRIGWYLYQYNDLQRAAAIHATSKDEQNDIVRMGIGAPVIVIPNGMNAGTGIREHTLKRERLAICITRLHPVKGLEMLVDAWSALRPANWKLIIAGPSEAGMRERLVNQINFKQIGASIELRNEVDDKAKMALFSDAELFVLPSFSENFGMAIAESLAHGLPVITTTGTPWSEIVPHQCGWFVVPEVPNLQHALQEATSSPAETLLDMGRRGQQLILNNYSWNAVAKRMTQAYLSIVI